MYSEADAALEHIVVSKTGSGDAAGATDKAVRIPSAEGAEHGSTGRSNQDIIARVCSDLGSRGMATDSQN